MPAVSIILPNYNHAGFLRQRIETILNQSFSDFELLIFDDASTDQSQEIISTFSDQRISHVEFSKENSGTPFSFWEKGLKMAKSNLIWIAESDDFSELSFLQTHVDAFKKDPSLIISFSASNWVDQSGKTLHKPAHENEILYKNYQDAINADFCKGSLIYNASAAVFRKQSAASIDFDKLKTFKYAGDWFFWSSFEAKGTIKRSQQRLNNFRRHENNVSFKAEKAGLHLDEGIAIVANILKRKNQAFIPRQKILAYWALKVWQNELPQKRKYLASLPSEINFWYLMAPLLSKIYK
jgi:glycosyltransferase involved in cell wall biosynthesis